MDREEEGEVVEVEKEEDERMMRWGGKRESGREKRKKKRVRKQKRQEIRRERMK